MKTPLHTLLVAGLLVLGLSASAQSKLNVSTNSFTQGSGGEFSVFNSITKYLAKGDAASLSSWFADTLDVTVISSTRNCSRRQAQEILRTFFSQKEIPAELVKYQALFIYEQEEPKNDVLGEEFDKKLLAIIEEPAPVKARVINMSQRLRPLFRAAAVIAILLTLGNAAQVPFTDEAGYNGIESVMPQHVKGASVAYNDSTKVDSMQQSNLEMKAPEEAASAILK